MPDTDTSDTNTKTLDAKRVDAVRVLLGPIFEMVDNHPSEIRLIMTATVSSLANLGVTSEELVEALVTADFLDLPPSIIRQLKAVITDG